MSLLPNIQSAATVTNLQPTGGNASANGTILDLQPYKGAVTFMLVVGQSTVGVGSVNANIQVSSTNDANDPYAVVTGGQFTIVNNTANASNVGVQVKSFDARALKRYVMVPTVIAGTNANVPVAVVVVAQKERV